MRKVSSGEKSASLPIFHLEVLPQVKLQLKLWKQRHPWRGNIRYLR
jgi:hypothetical protein